MFSFLACVLPGFFWGLIDRCIFLIKGVKYTFMLLRKKETCVAPLFRIMLKLSVLFALTNKEDRGGRFDELSMLRYIRYNWYYQILAKRKNRTKIE